MNQINEFKMPWDGVTFPYKPEYEVDKTLCSTTLEERNERIAAFIAQKYDLVYRQGDAITTKTSEQLREIELAHEEIGKYMPVHKIRWAGPDEKVYYFVFNSWEDKS